MRSYLVGMFCGALIGAAATVGARVSLHDMYVALSIALLGVVLLAGLAGCYLADAGTHHHAGVARKR